MARKKKMKKFHPQGISVHHHYPHVDLQFHGWHICAVFFVSYFFPSCFCSVTTLHIHMCIPYISHPRCLCVCATRSTCHYHNQHDEFRFTSGIVSFSEKLYSIVHKHCHDSSNIGCLPFIRKFF